MLSRKRGKKFLKNCPFFLNIVQQESKNVFSQIFQDIIADI